MKFFNLDMIEILKHAFGFCGHTWHPNLFTIFLGGLGLSPALNYIYSKLKFRKGNSIEEE